MSDASGHRAVEAVWRMEAARVIAAVARVLRGDVGRAEELAQDALVAALEQWPKDGIPENPGAWLTTAAKRRAVDEVRRARVERRARGEIGAAEGVEDARERVDEALDGGVGDDVLRLVFTACHPALAPESRAALALRLLCGLTTDEIARAFLAPEPTIAQRIVRAKRTLAEEQVAFEVPVGAELRERLASVLEVVYLLFNEGYAATSGPEWMRPDLCGEALRLGRVLQGLMPGVGEVHGLAALMELTASRAGARVDAGGAPVLLLEQDRSKWDRVLIRRGLAALEKARACGEAGPYALQAAIAACHARARRAEETEWGEIARLYGELLRMSGSPVVALNRAVAVGMAEGPAAGLALLDELRGEPALRGYHLLPAARGEMLERLGRAEEARAEFERAAGMAGNERERGVLRGRARG